MSLLLHIKQVLNDLPKPTETNCTREKQIDEDMLLPQYQCLVCRSRFVYLTSFVKSCRSHLTEVNALLSEVISFGKIPFDACPVNLSTEIEDSDESEIELESTDEQGKPKESNRTIKQEHDLPKNAILCCPLCKKTFLRRQTYRDHIDSHDNPLIKCCQICATEFSSGINANKHKKKFHPELYEQELQKRAAERALDGRKRNRLPPILIPSDTAQSASFVSTLKTTHFAERFRVILEKMYLPGCLKNDWIYLPSNKVDNYSSFFYVEKEHSNETNLNIRKSELNKKLKQEHSQADEFIDECPTIIIKHEKEQETNYPKRNLSSSYFIKQEEIPNVPQFLGSKYIFGIYSERRYKKVKEIKKVEKIKRQTSKHKEASSDDEGATKLARVKQDKSDNFLRPSKNYYKSESKTCKICGQTRTNSNIRRHVAKHCIEENDIDCRICQTSHVAPNKLREHYSRVHNIKFREYLYKMEKEKMEQSNDEKTTLSDHVTCNICFTNMQNSADLQYHVEMLHSYKEGGGKSKGSLDCNICGKIFAAVQNRNLHIRRIHKQVLEGSVFCHYCGKDFMGKGFLLSHFRNSHFDEKGVFKSLSTTVKKRYKHPPKEANAEDIAQHYQKYKVHSVCEICGLIKESRFAMMRHRYEKHDIIDSGYSKIIDRDREENDCSVCGKHFTSLRKWKDHEKYHSKEIPNLHCQVCGAKCKTETYLKAHMLRHGEKKFFCDYEGCGKSFAVKHDVKIHKRRAHWTDLDYICKICGNAFRTWNYRRYHEETVHGLVKVKQQRNKRRPLPLVAAVLQEQQSDLQIEPNSTENVSSEQTLESNIFHQFNTFPETEERDCQYCGKHFDDYRKWQNHEYYHKKINPDLACEICGAKCKTEYYLKAHIERHGEIKYFCEYPGCGKGFSVKHDVKIHQRRAHKDLLPVSHENQVFQEITGQVPVVVLPSPTLFSYGSNINMK